MKIDIKKFQIIYMPRDMYGMTESELVSQIKGIKYLGAKIYMILDGLDPTLIKEIENIPVDDFENFQKISHDKNQALLFKKSKKKYLKEIAILKLKYFLDIIPESNLPGLVFSHKVALFVDYLLASLKLSWYETVREKKIVNTKDIIEKHDDMHRVMAKLGLTNLISKEDVEFLAESKKVKAVTATRGRNQRRNQREQRLKEKPEVDFRKAEYVNKSNEQI